MSAKRTSYGSTKSRERRARVKASRTSNTSSLKRSPVGSPSPDLKSLSISLAQNNNRDYSSENLDKLGSARGDDFAPEFESLGGVQPGESVSATLSRRAGQSGGGNTAQAQSFASSQLSGPSDALRSLSIQLAGGNPTGGGFANTTGVVPDSPGANRDSYYGRYTDYRDEPVVDEQESFEDIQKRMMKDAQKRINSLYRLERSKLSEQKEYNDEQLRQTRARNALTGLSGSTEADRTTNLTLQGNQRRNDLIRDQIAVEVQNVLSDVTNDAMEMYKFERQEDRLDAQNRMAMDNQRYERAVTNATILAQSGVTAEGLRQTNPEAYQALSTQLGSPDLLNAMFTLNRPQDSILDKRIEGGKYVIAWQNPLDGSVKVETVDLGLPPNYTKTIDAGDRILAIPDDWSGDPSELVTINKGLTPSQQASGAGGGGLPGEQLYSGLTSATATAVRSKVGKFGSEPIVQNFATIQDGYVFTQSIDSNTTNPADDQALIYSLAKTLDPGSVVREGEYATAQKYAQSWAKAYGKGVTQAIAGTGFLSKEARENIKTVIETKYNSSKRSYDNLYNNYVQGINSLTGRGDGAQFLTDYVTANGGGGAQTQMLRSPDGQMYDASALTPEEYQEALNSGFTPV